jgi:MFS family permease
MQQRSLQQVGVSVSLIFLIHGLIIATWASRIPAFQAHLHLSPAVLGRSLMMAAIGSVFAMPAAGWLINKFGSLSIVIGSTLGFGLALPLIAESNTVLTLWVALLFYGAMAGVDGCSDEYSRRDAREAIPASHHVVIPNFY